MQNHMNPLTDLVQMTSSTAAVMALGAGTALGVGAAVPALAESPDASQQAPSAGPASGSAAGTESAGTAEQPPTDNDGPWKDEHGTAPTGYTLRAGTGSTMTLAQQQGLGSTDFKLFKYPREGQKPESAPDGLYRAKIGDGVHGEELVVDSKGGMVDLSGSTMLDNTKGQQMIQFEGPLNPDGLEGGQPPFLGDHGQPNDIPQLAYGDVYGAEATLAILRDQQSLANAGPAHLHTQPIGLDSVTFLPESTYALPDGDQPKVDVTYRDGATGKPVTVPTEAHFQKDDKGQVQLKGGILADLPSGRYTFSFTDRDGTPIQFFAMFGDPDRPVNGADEALYADPF
ncbi:hypothetical protein [Kocuria sp. TGY1127_2]|uniref:hypothetical protein n=1 Tax=Kocuria sp. TGY1127_2 TaxID=2711328 RepID=UPI0015BDCCA8|nr:hypothetical protein [Kocuria sp. TGY1127_2]